MSATMPFSAPLFAASWGAGRDRQLLHKAILGSAMAKGIPAFSHPKKLPVPLPLSQCTVVKVRWPGGAALYQGSQKRCYENFLPGPTALNSP